MDNSTRSEEANSIEEQIEEIMSSECISSTEKEAAISSDGVRELLDLKDGNYFGIDQEPLHGSSIMQHFEAQSQKEIFENDEIEFSEKNVEGDTNKVASLSTEEDVSFLIDKSAESQNKWSIKSLDIPKAQLNIESRTCRSLDENVGFSDLSDEKNKMQASIALDSKDEIASLSNATLNFDTKKGIKSEKSTISDESNKILSAKTHGTSTDEEDDMHMCLLRQKILVIDNAPACVEVLRSHSSTHVEKNSVSSCTPMENISVDFNREVLENITEESDKSVVVIENDNTSNDFDSIVSLNMIQALENKIKDLQEVVVGKDVCLASLNMQLESIQRKELYGLNDIRETSKELPPSGRDSSSLITSSTEYRTLQEDCGNKIFDFHNEIMQRDTLIDKLTVSLQQSMNVREQLQQQSEKLSTEVQQLRKQLSEILDTIKKPYWPRYQESVGQRLSEISIDLVSESDDDLDRQFLTDTEEKVSASTRNSKEKQINADHAKFDLYEPDLTVTKQIEQFQKCLNPDELRIFFIIQKKFDDFLSQEIEKLKLKHDNEMKTCLERMKTEAFSRDSEVNRLRQLLVNFKDGSAELDQMRQELVTLHSQEMENLRTYFEKKCVDLEKHYSEEIFSLKSQKDSIGSSSDVSDQTNFPEDCGPACERTKSKKRTRDELYRSPTHKEMTPGSLVLQGSNDSRILECKDEKESELSALEARIFYQDKIRDITSKYEETITKLSERLKKYESKYADDEFMVHNVDGTNHGAESSKLITDQDDVNNESQEIRKIAAEYERRLQEQVALAKEDLVRELEAQIQALLSESTADDQHWPPELILLREKFTAKSQLEIAQLQIKHEEEMSRLKNDFERQLTRKMKRNSTFDLSRDLDQIVTERNNLRELSSTLRRLLSELVKCVNFSESELNSTLFEEICKTVQNTQNLNPQQQIFNPDNNGRVSDILNISRDANHHIQSVLETRTRLIPNTSAILTLIEDPSLIEFVTDENYDFESFNLRDCLEKLKTEANHLLQLSENIFTNKKSIDFEENDCEEDDGLKFGIKNAKGKEFRTQSLNGNTLADNCYLMEQPTYNSLPSDVRKFFTCGETDDPAHTFGTELNFQMLELRDRLVKSETGRQKLQDELNATIQKNKELGLELIALRMQLEQLDSQRESLCEGYGTNYVKLAKMQNESCTKSLAVLQEKARNFLSTTCKPMSVSSTNLLQLIEDFCRESDKVLEEGKKDKDDLQSQMEQMERCINDYKQKNESLESRKDTLELELKASIDKIFVLREIISELETQIETKSLSEHVLSEKVKDLEACIASQTRANSQLQNEVASLKSELDVNNTARETVSKDELFSNVQQAKIFEGILEQFKEVENILDKKVKNLESLHRGSFSNSCSGSHSEDISFPLPKLKSHTQQENLTEWETKHQHSALLDTLQRVIEKLAKHTRTEEAAIKKISDLEANFGNIRTTCTELQNERDELQERMSEQQSRISSLQSKLDEQRHRADEIQRQGTSELMIKIHDMKNEIFNLKETLSARDKQLTNLKNQLEQSKVIIDRQEAELSLGIQGDKTSLETLQMELKHKEDEIKKLKERIKNDMINKLALPDLMETMLADKNEEIDQLKERLETKELEIKNLSKNNQKEIAFKAKHVLCDQQEAKLSARTLSDIGSISEYDEPDAIRKAAYEPEASIIFPTTKNNLQDTLVSSKVQPYTTVGKAQNFPSSTYFTSLDKDASSSMAFCMPRHLNFSDFTDNYQTKQSPIITDPQCSDVNSINANSSANNSEKNKIAHKSKNLEFCNCSISQDGRALDGLSAELNEKKKLLKDLQEKYETQSDQLITWEKELEMKNNEIDCLLQRINSLSKENDATQIKIEEALKKSNDYSEQLKLLTNVVQEKEEIISKQEKDLANYMKNEKFLKEEVENLQINIHNCKTNSTSEEIVNIRKELDSVRAELSEKVLMYEKCILDLETMEIEINSLRSDIKEGRTLMDESQEMVSKKRFEETKKKLLEEEKRRIELEHCNVVLEAELEKLRAQNSDPKPFSLDEIAERVEKELNYSAQLDSNILKAIESEEETNFTHKFQSDADKFMLEDTWKQLQALQTQLNVEKENRDKVTRLLNAEKLRSQEIQQQDADIIKAVRLQLQTALDKEKELYNILDAEREKCERLMTQLSILQRTEARKSSLFLKSPPESPKNIPRSPKSNEVDLDLNERHKNETKLLKSQIEREKERVFDLQRALDREKNRFEVEVNERIEYAEKLKHKLEKICHDKELSEQEVQHLQEKLVLAAQEIESLEGRISILQEAETRRLKRRDRDRDETITNNIVLHDLKLRNANLEKERDLLNQTIHTLRCDLERGAQREAKLAEAVVNSGVETNVPEQFLQKLKEMNYLLIENTKENRQMAETLLHLTVERKDLQKKCEELEYTSRNGSTLTEKLRDLEERANHLFGKYLRVESHRKALVHQKRYLLIVLQTYQDNETRALQLFNGDIKQKRVSFKSVALIVVAIQRMKFIVKRWQTGKKVASKSVLNFLSPKRLTTDCRPCFPAPM